jgi:Ca2+-binding EF-hand superfamily protein
MQTLSTTDGDLFDALRDQFRQLDMTGDGIITKKDLTIMATRKMKKISHKLELSDYKVQSAVLYCVYLFLC